MTISSVKLNQNHSTFFGLATNDKAKIIAIKVGQLASSLLFGSGTSIAIFTALIAAFMLSPLAPITVPIGLIIIGAGLGFGLSGSAVKIGIIASKALRQTQANLLLKAFLTQQAKEKGTTIYRQIVEKAKREAEQENETLSFEGIWSPSKPEEKHILGVLALLQEKNLSPQKINSFAESFEQEDLSAVIACLLPFITDVNLVHSIFGKEAEIEIQKTALSLLIPFIKNKF